MAISHLDRETASPVLFVVSVLAIQILGIAAMTLTGTWMKHYLGGFGWDGTGLEFDYHPLCMVISLVFLYSEGKRFTSFPMFPYNMQIECTPWLLWQSRPASYACLWAETGIVNYLTASESIKQIKNCSYFDFERRWTAQSFAFFPVKYFRLWP